MSISTRLKGFLDENEIPYSVKTHTTAYTAQGAAATMQISGKELAKTVILWAGEEMILAVLPANRALISRMIRSALVLSVVPFRTDC
jgi:prolyl-tRNA editing enzyme YbaK/EbsC (Cys-tRNA(Pro) deacylase)